MYHSLESYYIVQINNKLELPQNRRIIISTVNK